MANEQNLIPLNRLPPEKRKEIGRKGGLKKSENMKKRKAMRDIIKEMLDRPISRTQAKTRTALRKMGVSGDDATNLAAVCLQLFNLSMNSQVESKTKLRAIEMIHKIVDGDSIDITTNGKDITQEPLQVHVVTNSDEYRKILDEIKLEKERKDSESESEEAEDE